MLRLFEMRNLPHTHYPLVEPVHCLARGEVGSLQLEHVYCLIRNGVGSLQLEPGQCCQGQGLLSTARPCTLAGQEWGRFVASSGKCTLTKFVLVCAFENNPAPQGREGTWTRNVSN